MLTLPAVLTQAQASTCLSSQLAVLRAQTGDEVQVDASNLGQFDSSALAVLLEFRRETLGMGRRFIVKGLPERLQNLATLYGVAELIAPA
jgi:phospholipid transport system transporter-binding protein